MSVSINTICRKDRINQNRTTNIYLVVFPDLLVNP